MKCQPVTIGVVLERMMSDTVFPRIVSAYNYSFLKVENVEMFI